ncbi:Asp-tRNA(Asn)/Glu-tRNA(Gln) amidotransferase A subunit family amidase [Evansella vedderi]|uniref:Asp-tRNA(Asn)/Glu-tRNA(Gln) amidotransferase A subunit family amidase n=1 Tax=Evansella vedderi TaxID=38282 RepID=A0ABT9ZPN8_9BACI|nr:hypothetical protein [Evansella vedderi]MDQ0252686.1 Asp-tRNA(Asn)/Glu-tRNA(Gln) amidotransferase A subunit family amidase [Evansella vedderi]
MEIITYGFIYGGENFSELTIGVHEQKNGGSGWNSADGMMISAPAGDRKEGLKLSNQLMGNVIGDATLK